MFYAKSNPVESIREHTDKVLKNLEILKNLYGKEITKTINIEEERFWELMRIVCEYHDVGKVFTGFQNVIREKIKKELLPTRFDYGEIKHEQISPMFVPNKKFNMTKDERKLVYQAIYYHHEREETHIRMELLDEIIEEDLKPNLENIKQELNIEVGELKTFYLGVVEGTNRIHEGDSLYNDYCIMKGLLHRLDHCSSAGIEVEDETVEEVYEFTEKFIKDKYKDLNDLQKFSKENQDNNLMIIGSTGIGKTEASLIWSKDKKTFFTLPLRISINAIFDRILEKIKYEHVGLLHSTAMDYLEEKSEFNNELQKIEQSRNLYEKITTCTIDQIFTFVFKYKGYEKLYATLSYSKVIIDEIQAYSPEIVAVILKGLQMINNIGGKFMVMTATLPRIYKEELEKMGIDFKYDEFIKDTKRHKIKLCKREINDDIEIIYEKAKDNKVLVIVNTINKAIELYLKMKEMDIDNINLLHSRFILQDRNEKETKIKEFSNKKEENGIWITTQIVEASLDIDFDYLYTEMSTLDSLFQRLGRCYRNREYKKEECNVMIYTEKASGIKYVYDKEINKKSIELLQEYDNKLLNEQTKIQLVDKLYSREMLEGTEFYDKFEDGKRVLNNIIDYSTSKKEAQRLLRNIDNINVIPKNIYEENLDLFREYEKEKNYTEKAKIRRKINKLLISIKESNRGILGGYITECPYMKKDIYIIDTKYDDEIGLVLKKDDENEIDERMLG